MPLACSLYFFAVPTGTPGTPGWCCGNHLFRSEKDKSRWDNACGLRSLSWAGGQHNVPSSFHFAKKPSKGIEAVWKSYLTQSIAFREQLDESLTEADKLEDKPSSRRALQLPRRKMQISRMRRKMQSSRRARPMARVFLSPMTSSPRSTAGECRAWLSLRPHICELPVAPN